MRIIRLLCAAPLVGFGGLFALIGGAVLAIGGAMAIFGYKVSGEADDEPEITPRRRRAKIYSRA